MRKKSRTGHHCPPASTSGWSCQQIYITRYTSSTPAGSLPRGLSFLACSLNLSFVCFFHNILFHLSPYSANVRSPHILIVQVRERVWACLSVSTTVQELAEFDDDLHVQSSGPSESYSHFLDLSYIRFCWAFLPRIIYTFAPRNPKSPLSSPPSLLMTLSWLMYFTQSLPISIPQNSVLGPRPLSSELFLSDFIHGQGLSVLAGLHWPFFLWPSVSHLSSYLGIHLWGVHMNFKTDMSKIK